MLTSPRWSRSPSSAAVHVVDRVEDHGAGGRRLVADRVRDLPDDLVEQVPYPFPGLPGHPQAVLRGAADEVGQLLGVLLRLRGREIDLVEYRDHLQIVLQ